MSADDIEAHIPFLGALLKNEQDTEALDKCHDAQAGATRRSGRSSGPRYNN